MSKTSKPTSTPNNGDKGLRPSSPPKPTGLPQKHSYQPSSPPPNPVKIPPKGK